MELEQFDFKYMPALIERVYNLWTKKTFAFMNEDDYKTYIFKLNLKSGTPDS